ERLPRVKGTFAWSVAGERHEVELPPGGGYSLVLTAKQRATLKLEPVEGSLAVVSSWRSQQFDLPTSPTIQVQRTISPAADAPDDHLVVVRIKVTFGAQSLPECYRLTDMAPSGLSPVVSTAGWPDDEEGPARVNWPYVAGGQEVSWCASPQDRTNEYAYTARVVSPGTYRWEPTILQLELDPRIGASTPGSTY